MLELSWSCSACSVLCWAAVWAVWFVCSVEDWALDAVAEGSGPVSEAAMTRAVVREAGRASKSPESGSTWVVIFFSCSIWEPSEAPLPIPYLALTRAKRIR